MFKVNRLIVFKGLNNGETDKHNLQKEGKLIGIKRCYFICK